MSFTLSTLVVLPFHAARESSISSAGPIRFDVPGSWQMHLAGAGFILFLGPWTGRRGICKFAFGWVGKKVGLFTGVDTVAVRNWEYCVSRVEGEYLFFFSLLFGFQGMM